jgi:carbon monoxide dehydrogenase subunit G
LWVVLQATRVFASEPPAVVAVREERGVYTVTARFEVDQPLTVVMTVLTDYEQIPRFMPGVRSSIIREREAGHVVVEQEAVSALMMFSKRVHLILDIDEQPTALTFHDRCGRSFVRYQGAWRLAADDGRTAITYQLTAEPKFDVPGFVLKRLLRRDSTGMIEQLQKEIAARVAAFPALAPQTAR